MTGTLTNYLFHQMKIGDRASLVRHVGPKDIELFAAVSGDANPAHLDAGFAAHGPFGHVVVHGMWTAALISAVLGTRLPGPGTIYLDQQIRFNKPVSPGDTITAEVEVAELIEGKNRVRLTTTARNQRGEVVLSGEALVLAPVEQVTWVPGDLPEAVVLPKGRWQGFVEEARALPPVRAAVVHPCSKSAILGAIEVRDEGLLDPILIGPGAKIRAAAAEAGVSLDGFRIEETEHSHAAAARAVELAACGKVQVLVKGSLHSDELLAAVVSKSGGLRTERRISHVYAMDVPAYRKPVIVTDAAINIAPTLEHKRDICQNAVDLMRLLGRDQPKVAVLAAVETVSIKDFDDQPFVMYSPYEARYFHDLLVSMFTRADVLPRYVQHLSQIHSILAMVRAGLGVAIVPEAAASLKIADVKLKPLKLRAPVPVELFMVWRRDHENQLLPSLIEIATEIAAPQLRGD